MNKRKICVVTGSRAEYGLLYWVMKEIQADTDLQLQVIATGMHLSPEFGLTYQAIEGDGFAIDAKVEMLLSSDTSVGITKSMGLGVIGFADAYERLQPDFVVLLGDRFEIFAAAQAAMIAKIIIAHIGGGDTTEGAFDEAIRHSITKMAHLHFVTNGVSKIRVMQLGENPSYIFNVGSPGIDYIKHTALLDRANLSQVLDFEFRKNNILVTFHPVTLDAKSPEEDCLELLNALSRLGEDFGIIFTKPNADTNGRSITQLIDSFVTQHANSKAYTSLGQLKYLSLMSQVDVVVGNSSSGLYEAPSFKIPTVNIGDRQKGRLQTNSVINCATECQVIYESILIALKTDCKDTVNPYGEGDSSIRIKKVLKDINQPDSLLKKSFFELKYHAN